MKKQKGTSSLSVIFLLLFTVAGAVSVSAQGPASEALKSLEKHYGDLLSLRADLEMVIVGKQLDTKDTQKGKLLYVPGKGRDFHLRIDWVFPEETLIVINDSFWLYKERANQVMKGKVGKGSKAAGGNFFSFMTRSRKQIQSEFKLYWVGRESVDGKSAVHIRLEPKSKSDFESSELWISDRGELLRIKQTAVNKDETFVGFTRMREDEKVDKDEFRLKPKHGVQFVEV